MKTNLKYLMSLIIAMVLTHAAIAQIDEERMRRDIEVAENVLGTLIKNEVSSNRAFFGLEVKGTYQEGYGVTFRVPGDYSMPFVVSGGAAVYREIGPAVAWTYSNGDRVEVAEQRDRDREGRDHEVYELKEKQKEKKRAAADSARDEYNNKIIKAAKDFIADYGDFISQLQPNERIVVTNQRENRSFYFVNNKRTHLSVEGSKADITAFRQGKISRDQLLNKLKVVNTEVMDVRETDMELLASIFNRLYRPDLSTTYFTDNNIYYERLKDYGAIFYMEVFSSTGDFRKIMPTLGNEEMDEPTRNKKVTELYPKFEQELKDNILEYGRTLKSLKDDETLVFNVTLTKCEGCGIPSTLEVSVKGGVLKALNEGKMDKKAALDKFSVKKGPKQ